MRRASSLGLLALLTLGLTACAPSSEEAAMRAYLEQAQPIAEELSEAGAKFETLTNVQGDPLNWSEAEKTELRDILTTMKVLRQRAEDVDAPTEIAFVHALLPRAIGEMVDGIQGISDIADDPSKATDEFMESVTTKVEEAGTHAGQYATGLEKVLRESYPGLLEE